MAVLRLLAYISDGLARFEEGGKIYLTRGPHLPYEEVTLSSVEYAVCRADWLASDQVFETREDLHVFLVKEREQHFGPPMPIEELRMRILALMNEGDIERILTQETPNKEALQRILGAPALTDGQRRRIEVLLG